MSEVTGTLFGPSPWILQSSREVTRSRYLLWTFRRRIDAVAFAARKGIRLEEA